MLDVYDRLVFYLIASLQSLYSAEIYPATQTMLQVPTALFPSSAFGATAPWSSVVGLTWNFPTGCRQRVQRFLGLSLPRRSARRASLWSTTAYTIEVSITYLLYLDSNPSMPFEKPSHNEQKQSNNLTNISRQNYIVEKIYPLLLTNSPSYNKECLPFRYWQKRLPLIER